LQIIDVPYLDLKHFSKKTFVPNADNAILSGASWQLAQAFVSWAMPYIELDKPRWFAIDGKGLNGSITAVCEAHQQFVDLNLCLQSLSRDCGGPRKGKPYTQSSPNPVTTSPA
jgi:hypothetical protein